MAVDYTTKEKVVAMSNGKLVQADIQDDWIDWVTAEIDTMLSTDFNLKDEVYYIQMGELTNKIILKTPLYSVDIANTLYSSYINSESKDYVYKDSNNKQFSPIIYIKEHDSEFPPLTSATPLIEGKDYYANKTSINKIFGNWKQFVELRFAWGYDTIPIDIVMLASLMATEFSLSESGSTESMSERIGDYQYISAKSSTTGGFSDNIANLKTSTMSKYSLTSIAMGSSGVLSNHSILQDSNEPVISQTVSLPSSGYSG
jgi:hypothetical protein